MQEDNFKGIMWYLVQVVTVALTMPAVRYAAEELHVFQVIFMQNVFAFLFIIPALFVNKNGFAAVKTQNLRLHFVRVSMGVMAIICFFYAITKIPLGDATAISYTGPLFSTIMAAIILKERLHSYRVISLLVGFVGMLIILRPGTAAFDPNSLLMIAAMIASAFVFVFIRILARSDLPLTILFYTMLFSPLLTLPLGIYFWQTPDIQSLLWCVALGALMHLNVYPVLKALHYAEIGTVMPFDFLRLIIVVIIGYFLFDEIIDFWVIVGSMIILSSAVLVARRERNASRLANNK